MDKIIVAAIITGSLGLVGTLAKIGFDYLQARTARRIEGPDISGVWEGTGSHDPIPGIAGEMISVKLKLSRKGRKIVGEAECSFTNSPDTMISLMLEGKSILERHYKFDYKANIDRVVQYGSIVLKLDESDTNLNGAYCGYGPISKRIVKGDIVLFPVDRVSDRGIVKMMQLSRR